MTKQIGKWFDPKLKLDSSTKYRLIYTFDITETFSELDRNIFSLLQWIESVMCSGVQLELVNHIDPGNKRDTTLTPRIHALSFGAATKVINTLLWTNFEVVSTSHTCCDGSISIRSVWKSKDPLSPYSQHAFGSPQTYHQGSGTPRPMKKP